jgi:hypothetical protein
LGQSRCTHSILLVRHVPHRLNPKPKGFASILKNRPCRDRSLEIAFGTTKQPTSHHPSSFIFASRATKSLGPPQPEQIISARVLRRKPILELLGSFRILSHESKILYVGSRESSAYPHN